MKEKTKKKSIILKVIIILMAIFIGHTAWETKALQLNSYTVENEKIPEAFDGFKIAHISDLHNAQIGKDNKKLIYLLRKSSPDIIAITGDFVDSRRPDTEISLDFAKEALKIAPCFYVNGNHESRLPRYEEFKNKLIELGVTVLEDTKEEFEFFSETIIIAGVNDPAFNTDSFFGGNESIMDTKLKNLLPEDEKFTILLSHRPELIDVYSRNNADLILSGHTHGGQLRLPFIGAIYAPHQGFFPEYASGIFRENDKTLIISRGIGNSLIPFRINNKPEIVLITLNK